MNDIRTQHLCCLLKLILSIGFANVRIHHFLEHFGSAEETCTALEKGDKAFTNEELKAASGISEKQLFAVISYCEKHNIEMICIDDEKYPDLLKHIYNPPVLLFCRGNTDILNSDRNLSIVGSRNISDYSLRAAEAVAAAAVSGGMTVVSGFAIGADIAAHLSAVRNGGKTIAVLGCGVDYNYPEPNIKYKDEIAANGVLISEYLPQTAAKPAHFPVRNRILSGLSLSTVVIEAAQRSGSLNTVSHAINQGRDVWVIPPHDIFDPRYNGNKALLRDGAAPLCSPADILEEYFGNYSHIPVKEAFTDYIFLKEQPSPKVQAKAAPKPAKPSIPELDGTARIIYDIINNAASPLSADEIAAAAETDISEALSVITELEIEGIVLSDAGQTYYTDF
ncbi:MAG: DNA-processing protein DprA [Huintestinicola sp.]